MDVDMDLFSDSPQAIENPHYRAHTVGSTIGPYTLLDVLGHGQYGCVQLAIHAQTQERVAVKSISKSRTHINQVKKEVLIHSSITREHPKHIVRFITMMEDELNYYLVLEWAGGGELFDLIEPDIGIMDDALVHYYFCQLLDAIEFVHGKGIAHRDIKPENLLLDDRGRLKLSDFGLSTLYMHDGMERMLTTPCGSPIYMAPEVIGGGEYNGPAADLWSCGIVLYAMLFGATPWDEASINSEEFLLFRRGGHDLFNFNSIPSTGDYGTQRIQYRFSIPESLKDLLLGMLTIEWQHRWTLKRIRSNSWVSQPNKLFNMDVSNRLLEVQRKQQNMNLTIRANFPTNNTEIDNRSSEYVPEVYCMSQPSEIRYDSGTIVTCSPITTITNDSDPLQLPKRHQISAQKKNQDLGFYFSQQNLALDSSPVSQPMYTSMKHGATGRELQLMKHFAAERLLRFYTCCSKGGQDVLHVLCRLLESFLIPFRFFQDKTKIQFATVDSRKRPLSGHIQQRTSGPRQGNSLDTLSLIVFVKTKGDIVEFKRFFKLVHTYMVENNFVVDIPLSC